MTKDEFSNINNMTLKLINQETSILEVDEYHDIYQSLIDQAKQMTDAAFNNISQLSNE